MPVSVTMPQLGESVTEGTVTRWLKNVGDVIVADEPLLEVSTDKVDTEIPAPASGVLLAIRAGEDETVLVGGELAVIGDNGDYPPPAQAPAALAPAAVTPTAVATAEVTPSAPAAAVPPSAPVPVATPVAVAAPPPQPIAPAAAPVPAPLTMSAEATANPASGTDVVLPALGESVIEGTVTRWLKAVGDSVAADEPLLEVSTDKVDTELPAPIAGTLIEIRVNEDETVEVGAVLGVIGVAGAPASPVPAVSAPSAPPAPVAAPPASPVNQATPQAPAAPVNQATPAADVAPSNPDGAAYVTPLVRKLAAENDVDLSRVVGSGVGGRIRKQDVIAAADAKRAAAVGPAAVASPSTPTAGGGAPAASHLRGSTEKMSRLRKVIAERMVESLHVSAQLTSVVEVDVTRIAALRGRVKSTFESREGVKLSFLPFFAKASVEALKAYPQVNASIDQAAGTITYHEAEHLGIAVDTDRGLLVPVIRDAGDLNIAGLARKIADLAERTRTNKVSPDDLSGGTFTLTNTGSRGALFDTPIINQPQVAILGTGAVVKRAVVVSDETGAESIAIRSMAYLSMTYDHRLVDGADAARFLVTIKTRLEEGAFEAELGL